MAEIQQYILSVITAAIICAIAVNIIGKSGFISSVIKLLAGLFIVYTVIAPWNNMRPFDFSSYFSGLKLDGSAFAAEGKESASLAISEYIKQQAEAYILDKALSMGMEVTADIVMDDTDCRSPQFITISGTASPYNKQKLMQMISDELGIPKENQTWG